MWRLHNEWTAFGVRRVSAGGCSNRLIIAKGESKCGVGRLSLGSPVQFWGWEQDATTTNLNLPITSNIVSSNSGLLRRGGA
jgi:hypothetical protein